MSASGVVTLVPKAMWEVYAPYERHYDFFWQQAPPAMCQRDFDDQFETLLLFLVDQMPKSGGERRRRLAKHGEADTL